VKIDSPLIINACLTGMVPTKRDNPWVPVSPEEIAADAAACAAAGASIFHLHARDENGVPTYKAEVYSRILTKVREACPDAILCVSTSGRNFKTFEQRSEVLDIDGPARPEMASLTLGSLNFPKQASVNEPEMISRLAMRMRERGIVPELEVFDMGMLDYGKFLIDRKILSGPHYVNLLLGSLGTLSATPLHLALLVNALPAGTTWAAAGIGRFQFAMNSLAIVTGGHVRVGLEDNLFLDEAKQRSARNVDLIRRLVNLAQAAERPIASPAQARQIIGLTEASPAEMFLHH
jgi:3-keto-5-aminohexanoate cleavage enzyme